MKSLQTSRIWSVSALVLAITFVFWGISLLLNVNQYRDAIQQNIQIIENLTQIETTVRKLEGHFLSTQNADSSLKSYQNWQVDFATFRGLYYVLMDLSPKKVSNMKVALKEVYTEISFIDAAYAQTFFLTNTMPKRPLKVKVHQTANATVGVLKELISVHRKKNEPAFRRFICGMGCVGVFSFYIVYFSDLCVTTFICLPKQLPKTIQN